MRWTVEGSEVVFPLDFISQYSKILMMGLGKICEQFEERGDSIKQLAQEDVLNSIKSNDTFLSTFSSFSLICVCVHVHMCVVLGFETRASHWQSRHSAT
jgi:hypothetical protein